MYTYSELKESLENAEKGMAVRLMQEALDHPDIMKPLVKLAVSDEKPASWRAAWAMNHIAKRNKDLVEPYIPDILAGFPEVSHENQKGSLIRILSYFEPLHEDYGAMVDECLNILSKPTNRPFVKSYSMDFLKNISNAEPELKREIALAIEEFSPFFETGYLAKKGKQMVQELRKDMEDIDY